MSDGPAAAGDGHSPAAVALDARRLELAQLPDGGVVAKRGVREVLVGDPAAGAMLRELAELLDGTRSAEELLAAVEADRRGLAVQVLMLLAERGLLAPAPESDTPEARFWATFGSHGATAAQRVEAARVTVLGGGSVAHALVTELAACGVGAIDVVAPAGQRIEPWAGPAAGRLRWVDPRDAEGSVAGCSLLCATSDTGLSGALTDANREALAAGVPFLPVWVAELVGYAGPATEPFDPACLRCYQLRVESNRPRPDLVRALRGGREGDGGVPDDSGLLPPMATAIAAIAAM